MRQDQALEQKGTTISTSANSSASQWQILPDGRLMNSNVMLPPPSSRGVGSSLASDGHHQMLGGQSLSSLPSSTMSTNTNVATCSLCCQTNLELTPSEMQNYEVLRKRQYRVGLNLFNKNPPERGIQFLIANGFIEMPSPNVIPYPLQSPLLAPTSASNGTSTTMPANSSSSISSNSSSSSYNLTGISIEMGGSISPVHVTHEHQRHLLAHSVAKFLLSRKGLSKQQIGEYLGNLQNPFNQLVLEYFARQIDLSGLPVDIALRKYQTYFRFPGESQKIERLVQIFAARYVECNPCVENISLSSPSNLSLASSQMHDDGMIINGSDSAPSDNQADGKQLINPPIVNASQTTSTTSLPSSASLDDPCQSLPRMTKDDVFTLSFAIIMLNTDLHSPNVKYRMTPQQFVKNLRHVLPDHVHDSVILDIYSRVKSSELKTGNDHVTQVLKVQQALVPGTSESSKQVPNLALPHRRLVCFCRLYEVQDVNVRARPGQHQREVFLFNDLLLVTKIFKRGGRSANDPTLYSYRQSIPLYLINVQLFSAPLYPFGIRISRRVDDKVIIIFNARNDYDRSRFVDDLKESIAEMDEMETIRLRSRGGDPTATSFTPHSANRILASRHSASAVVTGASRGANGVVTTTSATSSAKTSHTALNNNTNYTNSNNNQTATTGSSLTQGNGTCPIPTTSSISTSIVMNKSSSLVELNLQASHSAGTSHSSSNERVQIIEAAPPMLPLMSRKSRSFTETNIDQLNWTGRHHITSRAGSRDASDLDPREPVHHGHKGNDDEDDDDDVIDDDEEDDNVIDHRTHNDVTNEAAIEQHVDCLCSQAAELSLKQNHSHGCSDVPSHNVQSKQDSATNHGVFMSSCSSSAITNMSNDSTAKSNSATSLHRRSSSGSFDSGLSLSGTAICSSSSHHSSPQTSTTSSVSCSSSSSQQQIVAQTTITN